MRTHRPTRGSDLNWIKDMTIAACAILTANLEGYTDAPDETMDETMAYLAADDRGDYASAASRMITFLQSYLTDAGPGRTDGWTCGDIYDLSDDYGCWLDGWDGQTDDYWTLPHNQDIPADIAGFLEDLSTAACGDWTNALG